MIDTVLSFITNISLLGLAILVIYKGGQIIDFHFHIKRCRGLRFVTLPASLSFFVGDDTEEDIISDPTIRRLMKDDLDKKENLKYKYVNINYTLDLEQVKTYCEYTLEDGRESQVYLNCTLVTFLDGTRVVLNMTYNDFDDIMTKYNNEMYNLI